VRQRQRRGPRGPYRRPSFQFASVAAQAAAARFVFSARFRFLCVVLFYKWQKTKPKTVGWTLERVLLRMGPVMGGCMSLAGLCLWRLGSGHSHVHCARASVADPLAVCRAQRGVVQQRLQAAGGTTHKRDARHDAQHDAQHDTRARHANRAPLVGRTRHDNRTPPPSRCRDVALPLRGAFSLGLATAASSSHDPHDRSAWSALKAPSKRRHPVTMRRKSAHVAGTAP